MKSSCSQCDFLREKILEQMHISLRVRAMRVNEPFLWENFSPAAKFESFIFYCIKVFLCNKLWLMRWWLICLLNLSLHKFNFYFWSHELLNLEKLSISSLFSFTEKEAKPCEWNILLFKDIVKEKKGTVKIKCHL